MKMLILKYADDTRRSIARLASILLLTVTLSCNNHDKTGDDKDTSEIPAMEKDSEQSPDGVEKIESNIKGTFKGWKGETLFPLSNGQLWKQCSYAYHYQYAYNPEITITEENGDHFLEVEGTDEKVKVCRITSFSNETVNGTFNGWNGSTVIKLMNGSEWKQFEPYIEIDIEINPAALLFDDGGSTKLWIEGTDQPVSVVRN